MASEELQGSDDVQNQAQPPAPAPAPVPTTLPPYPEMILTAIEALKENGSGSNKTSISKHIEATYGTLPPAHSTLLTHHLNKMKSAGQLHFVKNNYLIPDLNSPPRRGRGRPPKHKAPLPRGTVPLPPRPRGRPPKSRDTTAPPLPPKPKATSTTATVSGKKRGRPPKAVTPGVTATAAGGGVPRGRGRPPKVKPAVTAALVGA